MSKYVCQICGFVYDEAAGIPDQGIAPATTWEQLPDDWQCPLCGAPKSMFEKQGNDTEQVAEPKVSREPAHSGEDMREMGFGELSAVCSNLARGCEKQYRSEEAALFTTLAEYYASKVPVPADAVLTDISGRLKEELENGFSKSKSAASDAADRGAGRVLTWSEKVTKTMQSLILKYDSEGGRVPENGRIWVCDICGFIYVGDVSPAICPVCKVPSFKILEVK